jgi:uncharacterized protein
MTSGSPFSRRGFLFAAGGVLAGMAGMGTDAFAWATRRVQVTTHLFPVPNLPEELAGLRIAHVTDVHLYEGMHAAARRAMELVGEARPDVTVITGDLVENTGQLLELPPFLEACRGRLATVVVMGNWEYQAGVRPAEMARICEASDVTFLLNRSHPVRVGKATLSLVGLDDTRRGVPDPDMAVVNVPTDATVLWAFHAPWYADQLPRGRYPTPALVLSGHTHGGQIRPPLLPPITPPGSGRFVAGLYRDTFAPLYVARGIGTSGIRARLLCPPEVPIFTLRRA